MLQRLKNIIVKYDKIILLICIVSVFRVIYVDLYDIAVPHVDNTMATCLTQFFSNILSLGLTTLFIVGSTRTISVIAPYGQYPIRHTLFLMLTIMLSTLLCTVIIMYIPITKPVAVGNLSKPVYTAYHTIGMLPINLMFVVFTDLILYFLQYSQHLAESEHQKHKVQYQYSQLKQQLNPHFLFNTLNILDYLVQNEDRSRASACIRKLANIYRYLLNTGETKLVSVNEEMKFIHDYYDILKERFTDGIQLTTDLPESLMTKQIIPCALQILLENAIKHNVANAQHQLTIDIAADNDYITVTNNLQPKIRSVQSIGIGLKNISAQYRDIANEEISIIKTDKIFQVKLPLI
ncbi:MAG TPA: hypothetical protein DEO38_05570 [Bacteroidales bacterium]|nr:hypothetical protein [Bacteroidales bacterium]